MELKFMMDNGCIYTNYRFNRTFMELKYRNKHQRNHRRIVLIVPLWN